MSKTVQGQNVKTVRISGSDYVTVAERNRVAHEIGAELELGYEIIDEHWFQMGERWFVTMTIVVNGKTFKGTSEVKFNASPKTADGMAPAECAETSALGRALGFAGIGALDGIASADEILRSNPDAKIDRPQTRQSGQQASQPTLAPVSPVAPSESPQDAPQAPTPISDSQWVNTWCKQRGIVPTTFAAYCKMVKWQGATAIKAELEKNGDDIAIALESYVKEKVTA